jgi:hypothetical protein
MKGMMYAGAVVVFVETVQPQKFAEWKNGRIGMNDVHTQHLSTSAEFLLRGFVARQMIN